MKTTPATATLIALALVPGAAVGALGVAASTASAAPARVDAPTGLATLDAVRAIHVAGEDRVVFRFRGGLPASQRARYVDRLVADGSGKVIRVPGRATLEVTFRNAQAHDAAGTTVPARTAYRLPNAMVSSRSGDFEGVVTYGIGLAERTQFHLTTLHNPARVVVHVGAAFPTVQRKLWLFDRQAFAAGTPPFFVPRVRPVLPGTPATALMDRLLAGALPLERSNGLRTLRSGATGVAIRSISDGIARVQLTGGCSSSGSTATVAGEIMPTLRQLATVDRVKIYDPAGHTEHPFGHQDSIPACLEP
jgi:Sporulation and spore germination